MEASRLRYKQFVEDNRRDSASEPDDEFPGQYSTVSLGPLQEESIVRREDCELIQLIVDFSCLYRGGKVGEVIRQGKEDALLDQLCYQLHHLRRAVPTFCA